ncbi:MAG: CBS domain-containing protein, partial [Candidatus Omnitrophica bacterium]|nr:CBS domain-containing protein [Candidatus Omnitrophota bacterium]
MNKEFNEGSTRMLLNETKVKEVMSAPAKTLEVNLPFSRVEEMFINHHVRHLPIVDSKGILVGIITQKDLYKLVSPRKIVEKTLSYDGDKILD